MKTRKSAAAATLTAPQFAAETSRSKYATIVLQIAYPGR